ncbi:MAG: bacillithiol system redox-active protein YtxJ [Sphingobacteriaceae bacterium]|nr:bacillithiol system redox-active protein YtxJ [Sphingobacteriaceae bacterium]
MNTTPLEKQDQLEEIKSAQGYSVIFKHNTTCPISKNRRANFEKNVELLPQGTAIYFLDLLSYREISDAIATSFDVKHESPQLLLIKDGACTFHQSLYDISAEDTAGAIRSN